MSDFTGAGLVPMMKAVVTAIPEFFPLTLFAIWIFGTASSYYSILKLTGKKRFLHALTSVSFFVFLCSLVISAMNESAFTYLSGYWVGFYILMTLASWFMLDAYK